MKKRIILISFLAAVAFVQADVTYVAATANETGVYQREFRKIYDQPIFTVGKVEFLQVLETGKQCYKVKRSDGETGWIEKHLVKKVSSRGFIFEDMAVGGYLETPTPVYIAGKDDSPDEMIKLDRSFKDVLNENIDRETICRQVR